MRVLRMLAVSSMVLALLASCGGDSDSGADDPDNARAGDGGGGEGSIILGGEEIALGSGRCFLGEQDTGTGMTAELSGQASGTNAAGEEVFVDFNRLRLDGDFAGDAESDLAGDHVAVTVGDLFSGEATELYGVAEIGAVSLDRSTLSVSGFEVSGDDGSVMLISFEITC